MATLTVLYSMEKLNHKYPYPTFLDRLSKFTRPFFYIRFTCEQSIQMTQKKKDIFTLIYKKWGLTLKLVKLKKYFKTQSMHSLGNKTDLEMREKLFYPITS